MVGLVSVLWLRLPGASFLLLYFHFKVFLPDLRPAASQDRDALTRQRSLVEREGSEGPRAAYVPLFLPVPVPFPE